MTLSFSCLEARELDVYTATSASLVTGHQGGHQPTGVPSSLSLRASSSRDPSPLKTVHIPE